MGVLRSPMATNLEKAALERKEQRRLLMSPCPKEGNPLLASRQHPFKSLEVWDFLFYEVTRDTNKNTLL